MYSFKLQYDPILRGLKPAISAIFKFKVLLQYDPILRGLKQSSTTCSDLLLLLQYDPILRGLKPCKVKRAIRFRLITI